MVAGHMSMTRRLFRVTSRTHSHQMSAVDCLQRTYGAFLAIRRDVVRGGDIFESSRMIAAVRGSPHGRVNCHTGIAAALTPGVESPPSYTGLDWTTEPIADARHGAEFDCAVDPLMISRRRRRLPKMATSTCQRLPFPWCILSPCTTAGDQCAGGARPTSAGYLYAGLK